MKINTLLLLSCISIAITQAQSDDIDPVLLDEPVPFED